MKMSEQDLAVQTSTSDDITQVVEVEVKDAPATTEQAKVETDEETPAETVTLTKDELQAQKNAIAKKEREKAERKSQREIQALRAEFEALKAPPKEVPQGKPTLDQYETYDEFTEALTDWKIEQREVAREQKAKEESSKQQRSEIQKSFADKADKFRAETPDYDDVISEIADVELSEATAVSVIESDLAAQLTYYFGKNPDELERINNLSPFATAREIGKLEAKLTSEPKKQPKQSDAPEPIKPLGASKATVTPDVSKMTDEEWDRYEREQRYKKG
jgi:hypothetical protein